MKENCKKTKQKKNKKKTKRRKWNRSYSEKVKAK